MGTEFYDNDLVSDRASSESREPADGHQAATGLAEHRQKVAGQVGLTCSRCLESFPHPLHQRFNLRFSQEIPKDIDPNEDADLELTADQMGLLFFKGDELDLGDAVQEQVILALPLKPVCSSACKGLCPGCGADLNLGPCGCGGNGGDSPFDVLKSLKLK